MADPFEVRMRFTSQLQHLNASTTSATKAATYAMKHSDFCDDLHSCILEQLERNNMNNRANIMYFLLPFCELAKGQNMVVYVRMIERDIIQIIDLVAPEDGSGAANVKVVRKVIHAMAAKGFLLKQTVVELEEWIEGRDNNHAVATTPPRPAISASATEHAAGAWSTSKSTPHSAVRESAYNPAGIRLDKRQIEQRIEEDRERHKRAREGLWAVPQVPGGTNSLAEDAEVTILRKEDNLVDEDDILIATEAMEERKRCFDFEEI